MLTKDKCIISKYHHNCFCCVVILARIIQVSSGIFLISYSILVEVIRCLVVRSTRRFHVLHGCSKTGVILSAADLRRSLSAFAHSTLQWLK